MNVIKGTTEYAGEVTTFTAYFPSRAKIILVCMPGSDEMWAVHAKGYELAGTRVLGTGLAEYVAETLDSTPYDVPAEVMTAFATDALIKPFLGLHGPVSVVFDDFHDPTGLRTKLTQHGLIADIKPKELEW